MRRLAATPRLVSSIALLYAGMVIGVSFIAVPAKFLATSIDLAQALDVGRQTFRVFGWIECFVALVLVALAIAARGVHRKWIACVVLGLVAGQILILRPPMDRRLVLITQGHEPPPSQLHNVYGMTEVAKVILLLTLACGCAQGSKPADWHKHQRRPE